MLAEYRVQILDPSLTVLHEVDDYLYLQWERNYFTQNNYEMRISRYSQANDYLDKDNFIFIYRDGELEFTGIIQHKRISVLGELRAAQQADTGKASEKWEIRGGDPLAYRIVLPPSGSSHYEILSTEAETVLKDLVDKNVVSPVDSKREISWITVEADQARGSTIDLRARYDNLVAKLEEAARAGGIGWELLGTEFKVITGVNRSQFQSTNNKVVLSDDYGNIQSMNYTDSRLDSQSLLYVGGDGEGVSRTVEESWTAATEPEGIERREDFLDARDLTTTGQLFTRGFTTLRDQGPEERLEAQILTEGPHQYRSEWDLGDIITIRNESWGIIQDKQITSVRVTLEPRGESIGISLGDRPASLIGTLRRERKQATVSERV